MKILIRTKTGNKRSAKRSAIKGLIMALMRPEIKKITCGLVLIDLPEWRLSERKKSTSCVILLNDRTKPLTYEFNQ